jgi:hypothetical protein
MTYTEAKFRKLLDKIGSFSQKPLEYNHLLRKGYKESVIAVLDECSEELFHKPLERLNPLTIRYLDQFGDAIINRYDPFPTFALTKAEKAYIDRMTAIFEQVQRPACTIL